jgi:glycosyltransferase involved in cell wall biosynthesis
MSLKFSIILVSYNAGDRIKTTLESIFAQSYPHYEVILKDAGSTDHSWEEVLTCFASQEKFLPIQCEDDGIYTAMNQALTHASGQVVLFLGCGDMLFSTTILEEVAAAIEADKGRSRTDDIPPTIYYGDVYKEGSDNIVYAAPKITGFTCYRNIPCHQAIFYDRRLFLEHNYQVQYRIRGDYEHFLWCFYRKHTRMIYLNLTIASYEGGGFSEKREHRRMDLLEHRSITRIYMKRFDILKYELLLKLTLRALRRSLASNHTFTKVYESLKRRLYRKDRIH